MGFESIGDILRRAPLPGASTASIPGLTRTRETCSCQTCGASFQGEVVVRNQAPLFRPRTCPACMAAAEQVERDKAAADRLAQVQELRRRWRLRCGIPAALQTRTFANFKRRLQAQAYDRVKAWATGWPFANPRGYPSMLLFSQEGVYGVGKTHLLVAAVNSVVDRWDGDPDTAVCPVRFETGPSLKERIVATYNVPDSQREWHETAEDIYRVLIGVPLLVLDDVGKEKPSDHTRQVYYHLINERLNRELPVLVSSNKDPESDAMADVMHGATVSRLLGMTRGEVLELSGADQRLPHEKPAPGEKGVRP